MGAPARGGAGFGAWPHAPDSEPGDGGRSGADLRCGRPGRVRSIAMGRDRPHLRWNLRHPRRRACPHDEGQLPLRCFPRLDSRPVLGRRDLRRAGGLLRQHRRHAGAMAGARDAGRARRLLSRQLRPCQRSEAWLHMYDGFVPAARTSRGHRVRIDHRRPGALRRRLPARGRDQPHRAAADPGSVAAGARPTPGARKRDESHSHRTTPGSVTEPFDGVIGHTQALDQLRSQVKTDRLAHAYLFVGESGLGKSTAARALATALLHEAPLSRHPDYWEDDRIKPLSINEIRLLPDKPPEFHELSLQAFLNLKPAVGSRRVALMVNVGRLRDQDQGVLLKTLEEPHPNRVIILTTPSLNPFVVLPTVVSRCQRVFFHPVPAPEIEKLLDGHGVESKRARLLAELSGGRPGWALRRARDETVIELHHVWTHRLEEVFGAPADVPLNVAAQLDAAQMGWRRSEGEEEDPALFAIASWQIELRRRMLGSRGREQGRWARLLVLSYDTLGYLEQNVSPRLALETFLLECRKASQGRA